jgi:hypothetical protein
MDEQVKPLSAFPTGARVYRVHGTRFDFAYGRIGTVTREVTDEGDLLSGVVWDGDNNRAFQYPDDDLFGFVVEGNKDA